MPPTAVLALLFAGLIAIGTVLLMLPFATTRPLRWMDALFTAASAVTVTGLSVVDTGSHLSRAGQAVLLVLVQLGGLGMMTFTVMVLALLGQRLGIRQQMLLKEDLNQTSLGDLLRLVRTIAAVVAITEIAGAALLAARFVPQAGWSEGLRLAVFYSVSAFNQAGFSLFPDNLIRWAADPLINLVLGALIIIGGLGFSVLDEIRRRRGLRHLSLHSNLTLVGTAVLLAGAFVAFAALEWRNPATLGRLPDAGQRLLASFFQAVTPRSAGFNTLDTAALTDATTLLLMVLMFIGGGSTSTAGGIKVSSFMVLVIATLAFLRGATSATAFGRTISAGDILKVLALASVGLFVVILGAFVLMLTQSRPFLDLLFETVSAFGTVGLSRDTTAALDDVGRAVIIAVMFVGRIGPLALGLALARTTARAVRYPDGRVYLG